MRRTESHAIWSNVALGVDAAAGVALIAFATRVVPAEHFGAYLFALALVELLALMDFGLSGILPRAVIEASERQGRAGVTALVGAAVKGGTAIGLLLSILAATLGAVWQLLLRESSLADPAFVAALVIVVSGALLTLPTVALTRVFEAERRFPTLARMAIIISITRLAAGLLLLFLGFGVLGLAVVYAVMTVLRCGCLYVLRSTNAGSARDWVSASVGELRSLLRVGKWSAMDNGLRHTFFKGDVFLIGTLGDVVAAGVVGVGRRIPNLIWLAIVKTAAVSLPSMAQAHVQSNRLRQQSILVTVSVRLTQVGLPVVALWWLLAPEAIHLWVGAAYGQSVWAMRWALVGVAALTLSVPATNALYAADQVRASALAALAELVLFAAAAPLAIWWRGPIGLVALVSVVHIGVTFGWLVPAACRTVALTRREYYRAVGVAALLPIGVVSAARLAGGMLFQETANARFFAAFIVLLWLLLIGGTNLQRRASAVPAKAH